MKIDLDSLDVAALVPFEKKCYKRWITRGQLITFVLDDSTSTYQTLWYDRTSRTFSECFEGVQHVPVARTMPIQYFGVNGELQGEKLSFVPPKVCLSPQRKRICWLGPADDWVTFDTELKDIHHYVRNDPDGLSRSIIWFADQLRFAEPFYSDSFKSFVELDIYTIKQYECESFKLKNVRSGTCIGTTNQDACILVHPQTNGGRIKASNIEKDIFVTHIDLSQNVMQGIRKKAKLPAGFTFLGASVAPSNNKIAWLLDRSNAMESITGLWITDLNGQVVGPLCIVDEELVAKKTSVTLRDAWVTDLEWLPDEDGLSFVYGNCILTIGFSNHE